METNFTDKDVLTAVSDALRYENFELGLKPNSAIGNNDCSGMDTSNRPKMPLCEY